jgi:hypothetical protein
MTTNILVFYVILSCVHLSNISSFFFNVFLNQNYKLAIFIFLFFIKYVFSYYYIWPILIPSYTISKYYNIHLHILINIYQIISNILWKYIGDNKLAVNYLIQFVIKVLFMTPNYVTITITKFHTIWMFVLDI